VLLLSVLSAVKVAVIVAELLEGEALRQQVNEGALPPRLVLTPC